MVSEFWHCKFNAGTEAEPDMKEVYEKAADYDIASNKCGVTCKLCIHLNLSK